MVKKLTSKQQKEQLNNLFAVYNKRLGRLYSDYVKKLFSLGYDESVLDDDALFSFDKFPKLTTRLNDIFSDYFQNNMLCYKNGITDGVTLAYNHDSAVLGGFSILSDKALRMARNIAAETFISNRLNSKQGLNLAQTVWNYCQQTKSEFEMAMSNVIADGLGKGTSAEEMGKAIRKYLNNPDMMYRRYHIIKIQKNGQKKDVVTWRRKRIIDGKVRFVEEPLEKVGMGVYRSSRKNALRVARTEINAAYHKARNERWKNEPFVIGQLIHLSPQHDIDDICDELEGRYPKDFVWTGWHPQCMCTSDPILISGDEAKDFYKRLYAGEDMSNYVSPYTITDIPENYKRYIRDNVSDIIKAKKRDKLAWHLADNTKYWYSLLSPAERIKMGLKPISNRDAIQEAAKIRHAKRDVEKIQRRWLLRRSSMYMEKMDNDIAKLTYTDINTMGDALRKRYNAVLGALKSESTWSIENVQQLYRHFQNGISIRQRWDKLLWDGFSKEQIENCRELEKRLGILKGRPMSWARANSGRENPYFGRGGQYIINCQTCTVVHELRRRGFNIVAKGKFEGFDTISETKMNWMERFVNKNEYIKSGVWAKKRGYEKMSKRRISDFLSENLGKQDGRYEIYCQWKKKYAHVFSAITENNKILLFDPQTGQYGADVVKYIDSMKGKWVWVMRIDDKIINPEMSKAITTKSNLRKAIFGEAKSKTSTPASLFTDITKSASNKEKVSLLKSYIEDKGNHFAKINRYSSKDGTIFSQYADQYDKVFKTGEMPKNLDMARKLVKQGYDVYLMPNPSESNSFDFIIKKQGKIYDMEGKAFNGTNTLDHLIDKGAKQSSRVLVDVIGNTNTKYILGTVKIAFEQNSNLSEIWLFKGAKLIKVTRNMYNSKNFGINFKNEWNK
jgi:hypothetical protein